MGVKFMRVDQTMFAVGLATLTMALAGCDRDDAPAGTAPGAKGAAWLAADEPAGAIPVGEARQSAADGQPVVLLGHIGGSAQPFLTSGAAFTIVDPKVPWCPDEEGCPTPWDYCCKQNEVRENIATVKLVDAAGKLVASDAKTLLGVRELSLVVVAGMASRDDAGNFTVIADKVHIRK
jgi:hypothetical protein